MKILPHPGSPAAGVSILEITETRSHYLLSLNVEDALGADPRVELENDGMLIRNRGAGPGGNPLNPLKTISISSREGACPLVAIYKDGTLFIGLPKCAATGSDPALGIEILNTEPSPGVLSTEIPPLHDSRIR
jgi:hypothetical protein